MRARQPQTRGAAAIGAGGRSVAAAVLAFAVGGSAVLAQTPIPPSPKDFVLAAAQSDDYEILAATVAVVEGQDPRVRTFAQQMIRDHRRLNDALRTAAKAAGVPAPEAGLSSDQALLLSGLQGVRGAAFDKAYARQQMLAHAQAVAVEGSFASTGADATLQKAAQAALPTIADHLKMAQQLVTDLGGS